ncbi:MAG: RagB/SusD family nutrient uptake outer membrane protein [Bacteroidales bacterium]|nr:RagB/SusD family nutrient uptake outer membrane protein [Bacteroidales bacterium]
MKNFNIILALLAMISLGSCSLDESPYSLTAEQLGTSESGAEQLVTGIYATFWDNWCMEQTYMAWMDQDHDHCAAPGWVLSSAGAGNVTSHYAYNTNNDLWSVFYRMINRANKAKETFEASEAYLTDSSMSQLYGEVLFLRAFAYFHLVRMYGEVPLRLSSESEQNMARSSVKKVYDQITSDLETAIQYLYYPSDGNVGAWGHVDKTAAQLLLARVYATMGSSALSQSKVDIFVDIKGEDTKFQCEPVAGAEDINPTECYTRVKQLCDEIIGRRGIDFDLVDEYLNIWGGNNRKNKEFVWGVNSASDVDYQCSGLHYYCTPAPYGGAGAWLYMAPNLYSQYDSTDDRIVYGVWHYYLNSYTTANWYSYPPQSETYTQENMPDNLKAFVDGFNGDYQYSVPCFTKWYKYDISNPSLFTAREAATTEQDIPLLRFAEAYLLRAEALVELDQVNNAMNDIDLVRRRAKATTLYSGIVTDKVQARSLVLKERALELCQEFNRKFDLLRWGLYLKVMNPTQSIQCGNSQRSTVRTQKNLLYAIPTSEIAANELIGGNNYGY